MISGREVPCCGPSAREPANETALPRLSLKLGLARLYRSPLTFKQFVGPQQRERLGQRCRLFSVGSFSQCNSKDTHSCVALENVLDHSLSEKMDRSPNQSPFLCERKARSNTRPISSGDLFRPPSHMLSDRWHGAPCAKQTRKELVRCCAPGSVLEGHPSLIAHDNGRS